MPIVSVKTEIPEDTSAQCLVKFIQALREYQPLSTTYSFRRVKYMQIPLVNGDHCDYRSGKYDKLLISPYATEYIINMSLT